MGLLDDAIREHLDLKRRRGSDPDEVARLEHEALGPVHREPEPEPEPLPVVEPEPAAAVEHEPHDVNAHSAADARHSDTVHQPTTEFRVEDHHDDEHDAHAQPAPPPDEQISWADDLDADDPASAPAVEPGEDVLEETPEFLQETPEHDRLWFEQRPPRDFDFDG